MRVSWQWVVAALLGVLLSTCRSPGERYPVAPQSDVVDRIHGVEIPDPYRWLEDPTSPRTRRWIREENALTRRFLASIPERAALRERLARLWDHERYDVPVQRGNRLFYRRNEGSQDHSVLWVADLSGTNTADRVVFDPNGLSPDGTVALMEYVPSPDGRRCALGFSDGGSDWRTWRVLDVDTGTELPDRVTRNKFGGVEWIADGSGFFYSRFDRPAEGSELVASNSRPDVVFHRLGTPERDDVVVVPRPREEGTYGGFRLTADRSSLILTRTRIADRRDELDLLPLDAVQAITAGYRPGRPAACSPRPLVRGFDARYHYVGGSGHVHWIQTDLDAPRWRIVAIDDRDPRRERWTELVPEAADAIEAAGTVGGRLVVTYLHDATSRVRVFDGSGRALHEITPATPSTLRGFEGEPTARWAYFRTTGFADPGIVRRLDLESGASEVFRRPRLPFDPTRFETREALYQSRDGTPIHLFLSGLRGFEPDGDRPVLLYGYGGFGISITPFFDPAHLAWMELGGLLAVPNLRGGGEYGEDWHAAGTKENKQNVFDDFIAAAEWLIEQGYTRPERLAISGRSNGGLLVGACMTQRPDLFAAALPAVGVLDMLRYHRFTIGWAWAGDYGTSDDPSEFAALLSYSPLHNVHPGVDYPATLITTADHDDRVVPAHSFKFAAALQAADADADPILIRIETRAGHGAGKPTEMRIDEAADQQAFLVHELGVSVP